MASSEVDQKFLGRFAKAVEHDNPLLSKMLYKILGLSLGLSEHLVAAKREQRGEPASTPMALRRVLHILWLSREGLLMLHQYVIPMVGNYVELKVLAFKLRASFHHIFVLFHNNPPVSTMAPLTPEQLAAGATPPTSGKGREKISAADRDLPSRSSSIQPTHPMEGGPVQPPPGFEIKVEELRPSALLPWHDYLPTAHQHFRDAITLSEQLLWGSHSLRLSVKTEYAAFLYVCVHDPEASRKLAKSAIAEAYDAEEGMTDDMFRDTCELVTVLGKMMKRGLNSSGTVKVKDKVSQPNSIAIQLAPAPIPTPPSSGPPPGMENPI